MKVRRARRICGSIPPPFITISWEFDQSLGVQYSFSPQQYKAGDWAFYDEPLVATYGTFYRVPLGNPAPIQDRIASSPGSFGYDEATHKFNLPPPTGRPDLTVFASRSTIDTGLETLSTQNLTPPGVTKQPHGKLCSRA